MVEIAAPKATQGWFLHALTGMEWLLRLVFRVGKKAFNGPALAQKLGIRSLNESPELGLQVYGADDRVWITDHKGPWQSVTILVNRLSEIETPAFRTFIQEAANSFQATLKRMQTKPEDVMPWKLNGERWHLGEKGFPVGKKLRWDRALLPKVLDVLRSIEPKLEVRWDTRDAITIKVPGVSRGWAQFRTKEASALFCRFLGKKGQFNLSQIEGLGVQPTIDGKRAEGDVVRLHFQTVAQVQTAKLKQMLVEHLRGFREAFGGKK